MFRAIFLKNSRSPLYCWWEGLSLMKHRISGKENCTLNHTTNIRHMENFQTSAFLQSTGFRFFAEKMDKNIAKKGLASGVQQRSTMAQAMPITKLPFTGLPRRPGNASWVCRMATEIAAHQMKLRTACFAMAAVLSVRFRRLPGMLWCDDAAEVSHLGILSVLCFTLLLSGGWSISSRR